MAGKKKGSKKAPKQMLIVQSKVKEYIKGHEMMCSSELLDAINEHIHDALDRAVERAQANNRKTARPQDI